MNKTKLIRVFLPFLLVPMLLNATPSAYFTAVTNLYPAGYWPMHEVEAAAAGDIETNYGTLGALGNAYYPDYRVNVGAFVRQMGGALAGDSDPAVFWSNPVNNGGSATNGLFVPHTSPKATLVPPFSFELWFNVTNAASGTITNGPGYFQGDALSQADQSKLHGFRIYDQDNGVGLISCLVYPANGGFTVAAASATNVWHHLVVTCDAATNMIAYFDGTKTVNSTAEVNRYQPDFNQPLTLGEGLGNQRGWHGLLDEVAIYTNVLAAGDVTTHYNDGVNGPAGQYFTDVTSLYPTIYLRMNSLPYTPPDVSTWPALQNYGQTNGVAVGNGTYTPGTVPGFLAGGAYTFFPVALNGASVAPLSGVSSYADAGFAAAYNPTGTNPFTVSALFRGNPTDTNRVQSIVGHGTNSWQLGLGINGVIVFNSGTNSPVAVATGSAPGDLVSTSSGYDDGNWHQVVAVHSNTVNILYVDGVANKTNTVNPNNIGNSFDVLIGSDPCFIDAIPTGLGRQFAGQVCEVALFTNALGAPDVLSLYNQSGVVPVIVQQPASTNLNAGLAFTNRVTIGSSFSAPVSFQWYYNTTASYIGATGLVDNVRVFGSASTSLAFTATQPGDAGYYFTIITNNFGSVTSSIASLTVYGIPLFTGTSPTSNNGPITLYGGLNAGTNGSTPTFTVSVLGPQLGYEWFTNGVYVQGASGSSFTLTNCRTTSPTSFKCVVTNLYGSMTNTWSVAYLAAPTSPYPQAVLGDKPMAYWRLNEPETGSGDTGITCADYASGNNALYTNVILGNLPGYSSATDPAETAAEFGVYPNVFSTGCLAGGVGTNVDVSCPSGVNGEFSLEVWANGNSFSQAGNSGLLAKGYFNGEQTIIDEGASGAAVRFFVRYANGTGSAAVNSTFHLTDSAWHHIVGVCDQANATIALWVDGIRIGTAAATTGAGVYSGSSGVPFMIGARSTSASTPGNNNFRGFLNEAAIYNYALSSNQIVRHFQASGIAPTFVTDLPSFTNADYNGTMMLPVTVSGSPTLFYRWYNSSTNIIGQTNATLIQSNYVTLPYDTFYVSVSNAFGIATSTYSAVTPITGLEVDVPVVAPFYGIEGLNTNNSVVAHGMFPLSYQWQVSTDGDVTWFNVTDNGRITGSRSSVLNFAPVYPADAADYQVIITNSTGSSSSGPATLRVAGLPLSFYGDGFLWAGHGSAHMTGTPGLLSMTDPNNGGGGGVFWFPYPQYIGDFIAQFTYQAQLADTPALADGLSFCVQNDSRGTAAQGSGGGGLDVGNGGAVAPSAELMLDIFSGSGYAFGTNGANVPTGGATSPNFRPAGTVNLASGDPINITVDYVNGQLGLSFFDTVTSASFSTNFAVPDLTQLLGADTALVGFTASYGGSHSVQTISNFSFFNPVTLGWQLQHGTNAVAYWPGDILGYLLQQNSDLTTTNWSFVTNKDNVSNGLHQVLVPVQGGKSFYRLKLME